MKEIEDKYYMISLSMESKKQDKIKTELIDMEYGNRLVVARQGWQGVEVGEIG